MSILKKITLIGCGLIGSLIASELDNKKNKVTNVNKSQHLKKKSKLQLIK